MSTIIARIYGPEKKVAEGSFGWLGRIDIYPLLFILIFLLTGRGSQVSGFALFLASSFGGN